ncbi:hypothetical protein C8R45DRAFT_1077698 [Mycena sanguinolenta]|nr:hypothetical protein C8R45DRAFT_1077698 [Mycena sanguinolenta]
MAEFENVSHRRTDRETAFAAVQGCQRGEHDVVSSEQYSIYGIETLGHEFAIALPSNPHIMSHLPMRLGNSYFTEVLELAIRLSDLLRSGSDSSNIANAETVKELTLLCAELDFTQRAIQNLGTLLLPTLVHCIESRVVECFATLSQVLAITAVPVHRSESGDTVPESFRIQIAQLRVDIRRLLVSIMSGVHESQYNRSVTDLTVIGGIGGMGGPGNNGCPGGAGGNGEGPRLIADNFIVGTLVINPRTGGTIPRGIHDHIFWVIDPVGGSIPISLRYCQTYVELDRILKACLAGRPDAGTHYVMRGEYGVVLEDATKTEHEWYKCENDKCSRNFRIESQDEDCEELVSTALANQDKAQFQSFLRVHIQLIHFANPIAGDVPDTPAAASFTTRIFSSLNWLGSASPARI